MSRASRIASRDGSCLKVTRVLAKLLDDFGELAGAVVLLGGVGYEVEEQSRCGGRAIHTARKLAGMCLVEGGDEPYAIGPAFVDPRFVGAKSFFHLRPGRDEVELPLARADCGQLVPAHGEDRLVRGGGIRHEE
jgi:hypothetical protein